MNALSSDEDLMPRPFLVAATTVLVPRSSPTGALDVLGVVRRAGFAGLLLGAFLRGFRTAIL